LPDVWYFTGLAGILLQIWQWPIFLKFVPAAQILNVLATAKK